MYKSKNNTVCQKQDFKKNIFKSSCNGLHNRTLPGPPANYKGWHVYTAGLKFFLKPVL